jgi:hypothetical protein
VFGRLGHWLGFVIMARGCYNRTSINDFTIEKLKVIALRKKYSRAQMDYLASKEHFLQVSQQADVRIAELKQAGTEIGQNEMEDIIEKVGLHRAFNELVQAENTLINWTQVAIKNEPEFMEKRDIFQALYEKVKTDHESRVVLIDLAMKLSFEKV